MGVIILKEIFPNFPCATCLNPDPHLCPHRSNLSELPGHPVQYYIDFSNGTIEPAYFCTLSSDETVADGGYTLNFPVCLRGIGSQR